MRYTNVCYAVYDHMNNVRISGNSLIAGRINLVSSDARYALSDVVNCVGTQAGIEIPFFDSEFNGETEVVVFEIVLEILNALSSENKKRKKPIQRRA